MLETLFIQHYKFYCECIAIVCGVGVAGVERMTERV